VYTFRFENKTELDKACKLLREAMDSIVTDHFDHGEQPSELTITVKEKKNADIIEGLFKQKQVNYMRESEWHTVAGALRAVVAQLQPSHFNPSIVVETKVNYGTPHTYVTSDQKEAIQALTGQKTLSKLHIEALKALGFVLHERSHGMRSLSASEQTKPHQNYLRDHSNCPECGERKVMSCRCRLGNKRCANGHEWHTCDVHKKVFVGDDSHKIGALRHDSECTCPPSKEEMNMEPVTAAYKEYKIG